MTSVAGDGHPEVTLAARIHVAERWHPSRLGVLHQAVR